MIFLNQKKVCLLFTLSVLSIACSKSESLDQTREEQLGIAILPSNLSDDYSEINKTTSWYRTNYSFDQVLDVSSLVNGFEWLGNRFAPITDYRGDRVVCCYYWYDEGQYLFTDLNGDGKKDLWATYLKAPWPTDANGLYLYKDNFQSSNMQLDLGLTQVRKQVLSDFNKDGSPEITLFSSGADKMPFPGDSLAFFDTQTKKYTYLSKDIGYFHGGATGDVDGDGLEDIIAYSGWSANIPVHPTFYKNDGFGGFELKNDIFQGFTANDNFYSVELFDIDDDGYLDLFLGTRGALLVFRNVSGVFNRETAINIQTDTALEVMDMSFLDFDKDGIKEILVMNNLNGYNGYSLNLYRFTFDQHEEITKDYFLETTYEGYNSWIKWLRIFDYDGDGDLDIVGDGLFGDLYKGNVKWKEYGGKFIKEQKLGGS